MAGICSYGLYSYGHNYMARDERVAGMCLHKCSHPLFSEHADGERRGAVSMLKGPIGAPK